MQPNAVWIGNQKGGVGKTTLTAQLAGLCATAGWKVLCIDLDPQGNLARHLGVVDRSDDGRNLFDACVDGAALTPLTDVRPGLDLVPAGERWAMAMPKLLELAGDGKGLERAIAPVAADYDVILLDTPPTGDPIHTVAGLLAHYLLVVTSGDDSSIDGLRGTFRRAVTLRDRPTGNPDLEVLGVVLFGVPTQATSWRDRALATLHDTVGDAIAVFEGTVRGVPATAASLQRKGLLVTEGESLAVDQVSDLFKRLRKEVTGDPTDEIRLSTKSTGGLADDYMTLTAEFQRRFSERQVAYAQVVA